MENSLSSKHPELVPEWSEKNYPLTPEDITFGSRKVFWWKGTCGHEWQASVKARHAGERCPICANMRVVSGVNDLSTLRPDLAAQWSDRNTVLSNQVTIESHKKVWWKGPCGHEWEAEIRSRAKRGNRCPYCSSRKLLPGFNDLKTRFPEVAKEWSPRNNPLKPEMVTAFSNQRAWWRCGTCKNEWYSLISTRAGGSKCPYCSGITLLPGFNDLKTVYPELAAEWSSRNGDLQPDMVNEKNRRNVWWTCSACGHEYRAVIASRVKGLTCPVCANRQVKKGFNDLPTTDPGIAGEWDYERNSMLPSLVSRFSCKRVWWRCRHGHHWSMQISDRTIDGKGCIYCEQEFMAALPDLAAAYYVSRLNLRVLIGDDSLIGIPIEVYIPEVGLAVDFVKQRSQEADIIRAWKKHLCETRGITLAEIRLDRKSDSHHVLQAVKKSFQKASLFIQSDEEEDMVLLRRVFDRLQEQKA